jgi:hypothetical protein
MKDFGFKAGCRGFHGKRLAREFSPLGPQASKME